MDIRLKNQVRDQMLTMINSVLEEAETEGGFTDIEEIQYHIELFKRISEALQEHRAIFQRYVDKDLAKVSV